MVLHADKLRWLLWLRWKMVIRSFTRGAGRVSRIIGTILLILFGLPLIGSIGVATFFAYRFLPFPSNAEILFLVLTAIYILWILLPLLEFTVNEGLDISKLALFPLTRAELMVSLVLSSLLDIPTIGLLLIFAAVVAGWAFTLPLALMALLTMLVFYVQVIGISQLVLALLMRVLQSRRFRDLSIIIIALFSSSCYLMQQLLVHVLRATNIVYGLQNLHVSNYLQWLPPGMAAKAIQQAYEGNWGMSFVWLGALLALSVLVLYLWQNVVEHGLTADNSGGTVRVRQQRITTNAVQHETVGWGFLQRLLPPQVIAIAIKDAKYLRRDPQLQASLLQSVISVLVVAAFTIINLNGTRTVSFTANWSIFLAPAFGLLSLYTLTANTLGWERQSLTTLFLFPIDPRHILWGKNLVTFIIGFIEVCALTLASASISHAWDLFIPTLVIGLAGVLTILGWGNLTSVLLPQRMRPIRRGFQTSSNLSSEAGCMRSLLSIGALLATTVVLLPVAIALILPLLFQMRWIWAFSLPASLAYSIAFYYIVTSLVAPQMLKREPEILAVVARES